MSPEVIGFHGNPDLGRWVGMWVELSGTGACQLFQPRAVTVSEPCPLFTSCCLLHALSIQVAQRNDLFSAPDLSDRFHLSRFSEDLLFFTSIQSKVNSRESQ